MLVLGIESSCDETAFAVVEDDKRVLSSVIASQMSLHAVYGGVIPEIAAREHLKAIYPTYLESLRMADKSFSDVDMIAITQGPGLVGALLVGTAFAKGLAHGSRSATRNIPLVPVDHVHAHVHGALLGVPVEDKDQHLFPCLALVVSGGHSNLYYMQNATSFELLSYTIDDACGECFDKVAKLLGLAYPGGPVIERMAKQGDPKQFAMPKMMVEKDKLLFSYSGLKTHMYYLLKKLGEDISDTQKADACAAFQEEALGQLVRKLKIASEKYPAIRSVVIAGGVSANQRFRELMRVQFPKTKVHFPDLRFCSDNAAMIAAYGWNVYQQAHDKQQFLKHNWDVYSRYKYDL